MGFREIKNICNKNVIFEIEKTIDIFFLLWLNNIKGEYHEKSNKYNSFNGFSNIIYMQ